ncbi:malate synthase A [Polyangium sp. y55x31]|uniref:malate synthase A n=1 Tax=Polyangium sp. y55x31 TaxID=3042688 RepID=UPI0024822C15|nr:malate synthase A [Polyangium sp. y55x31]MDI1476151.1 malate synthase A [Polyangium sp. y55x31]
MHGTSSPVTILGPTTPSQSDVLTPEALQFVIDLTRAFRGRIDALLARRAERRAHFLAGERPDFLEETAELRAADWSVAAIPDDIQDRSVEITGPVDRKMIINALNSGANVFMADFEDATSPTFANLVEGQKNLADAVRGTIGYVDPTSGKSYTLGEHTAVLFVRPRGLHLPEKHMLVDGKPVPGSLFDFGLYFFHNARALVERGKRPYFYLPKLESHLEARLWNDVFLRAQAELDLPPGTLRATVLIETLPAAFEMDEILYELREHSAGLNCGRWDYIFSFIKKLGADPAFILPDRSLVTMDRPFLKAYTDLVVKTCHRRGAHAMGGMAAQIPIKGDEARSRAALDKVRADKLREVHAGHDGTWVAHPGLVPIARQIFDAHMDGPNQIDVKREDVNVQAEDLLRVPDGPRTEAGLRHNIKVGILYIEAWLRGIGCVPLYDLMEDAATAEICRAQVWQWQHHGVSVEGEPLDHARLVRTIDETMEELAKERGAEAFAHGRFEEARELFTTLTTSDELEEFLTLPAYERLLALSSTSAGETEKAPVAA